MTAVAAGRAALGHVFLAPPGDDAVAAVPSGYFNLGLVDKLHGRYVRRKKKRGLTAPVNGERTVYAAGSTETCWRLRLVLKVTMPSVRAKSVWSRPRPTLAPG
jgi:hypothetical protein